jgi:hypothetical protein
MTTAMTFRFRFTATSFRNDRPFVAHVTWDTSKKTLRRDFFPIDTTPTGRFYAHNECVFTANVGEIIETSRGQSKTREFRSFNLVAPTGYLIMVCMCDEMNDVMPVMSYLAGAGTIDHIAKGRWSFHTVTSEWKGELATPGDTIPINTNGTPKSYKEQLQARMQSLESELSQVSALLNDQHGATVKRGRTKQGKA